MLKIVVFDSGFGGELFADKLKDELGVVEIIRVIDWRNADLYLKNRHEARAAAEKALKPYLGRVDLIVFANFLLTITSLKYFRKQYPSQKFIGLDLVMPSTFINRNTVVLTTSAVSRTVKYRIYVNRLHRNVVTMALDDWPSKIDDGELTKTEIRDVMLELAVTKKFVPKEIILACSQFNDIKPMLKEVFDSNIKIHDSFNELYCDTCKILKIRGGVGKRR
ncbi:hypothetical protein IKW73_01060 [Candidatus Saccharibacteria bacterium]|nr:hypothetical protein [Candidatus Saccharibacteria bacterium]